MESLGLAPTRKNLALLFFVSLLIRAAFFFFYVQHEERYNQADSPDYHSCAVGMTIGTGMHRFHNKQPIFWRTPGYPLYLSYFYKLFGITSGRFEDNIPAQKAAIWVQIIIDSLIPLIIFFLAL